MAPSPQNHPPQRRNIGKVPAPGQGDVFQCRLHIVGRVKIHPTRHRAKHRHPRVGRIRAEPVAPNVIPGKVVMSLVIRDLSLDKM